MIEVIKHSLGLCGETVHPTIFNILLLPGVLYLLRPLKTLFISKFIFMSNKIRNKNGDN